MASWKARLSKYEKTKLKVLSAESNANIDFDDLRSMLTRHGFTERIKGDHHIFTKPGIPEIINLQQKSGKAKPYQVKQVRAIFIANNL